MKASDLKVVAIILAIALFFTIVTSNAVSIASVVLLAKGNVGTVATNNTPANNNANQQGDNTATNTGDSGATDVNTNTDTPATPVDNTGDNTSTTPSDSGSTGTDTPAAPADNGNSSGSQSSGSQGNNNNSQKPSGGNTNQGGNNANAWDKAKAFNFYKTAAHELKTKGNASYDKIEFQKIENLQMGSVGSLLQPIIDSFMTKEADAEVQKSDKGETAMRRFSDCTLTDMSKVASATKQDLPNGNYKITIVMQDEDTPQNANVSFLGKVTDSVLFWDDIQKEIDGISVIKAVNSKSVNYKAYRIEAEMTKDGKFVSLGHYATADIKANAKITVFTLDLSAVLYNTCKYSNFKY